MTNKKLPITEELDFAYLLELMPPLHDTPEFSWLPELFAIIGHERLLSLCKFAGGETIRIPTVEELQDSLEALQWFYDIHINKTKTEIEVPRVIYPMYLKIVEIYDARNHQTNN